MIFAPKSDRECCQVENTLFFGIIMHANMCVLPEIQNHDYFISLRDGIQANKKTWNDKFCLFVETFVRTRIHHSVLHTPAYLSLITMCDKIAHM